MSHITVEFQKGTTLSSPVLGLEGGVSIKGQRLRGRYIAIWKGSVRDPGLHLLSKGEPSKQ